MKKNTWIYAMALIFLVAAAGCNTTPKTQTDKSDESKSSESMVSQELTVNLESSEVTWKGEMLGVYSHSGTVDLQSASLEIKGSQVVSGSFVIDLGSITPTDENYSEDRPKENLVGHLSSPDFFDVENFPTAKFVVQESDGQTVTGELTIRGTTHTETFESVMVSQDGNDYKISGKLVFDRKKYDVSFDMTIPDMVLSNDIEIGISLLASI